MSKAGWLEQNSESRDGAEKPPEGPVSRAKTKPGAEDASRSDNPRWEGCRYDHVALEASVNKQLSQLETNIHGTLTLAQDTLKNSIDSVAGTEDALRNTVNALAKEFRQEASASEKRLMDQMAFWAAAFSELITTLIAATEKGIGHTLEMASDKTRSPYATAGSQSQGRAPTQAADTSSTIDEVQDAVRRAHNAKPAKRARILSEAIRMVEPLTKGVLGDSDKVRARVIAQELRYLHRLYPKDYAEASALARHTNSSAEGSHRHGVPSEPSGY